MTPLLQHFGLSLENRALFSVPDAADLDIVCEDGTVWITVDGDLRDYVLERGDRFQNSAHRRAVIYAMRPSRLHISSGPDPKAAPASRRAPRPHGLVLEQVYA